MADMADISQNFSSLELHDDLHPSHHHFDFLALPGELRNQIYRLTLTTDPPRLDREHKYSCNWCTWDPDEPQNRMVDRNGETLLGCRCWARQGLALLQANRKIHGEAGPIFWAENHFSFQGVGSFIRLVGGSLRPQYRQIIPHVTIYLDPESRSDMDLPPVWFWDVLFECKGLRTLEIPPYHRRVPESGEMRSVYKELVSWPRLTSKLPNLITFSWSWFGCSFDEQHLRRKPYEYPYRVTKCFDLSELSPERFRRRCPFTRMDIIFGSVSCIAAFLQGPRGPVLSGGAVSTGRPNEYQVCTNTIEVTHPEAIPTTWTIKFSLLPLSRDTIARNAMLKTRDENSKEIEKDAYSS